MQIITYLILAILSILITDARSASKCPRGVSLVNCLVDPCSVSSCPGDSNATCKSNYCGGCNAVWTAADGKPAKCCVCPPDQPQVNCFADPCLGKTCSNYPEAKCIANYCGGCNAEWFLSDGTKVQCTTTTS